MKIKNFTLAIFFAVASMAATVATAQSANPPANGTIGTETSTRCGTYSCTTTVTISMWVTFNPNGTGPGMWVPVSITTTEVFTGFRFKPVQQ